MVLRQPLNERGRESIKHTLHVRGLHKVCKYYGKPCENKYLFPLLVCGGLSLESAAESGYGEPWVPL